MTVAFTNALFLCSWCRVTNIVVEDPTSYFELDGVKGEPWFGRYDLCATDPPCGCLKDAKKIQTFAKGLLAAGNPEAVSAVRLTLEIYMDWKRAFTAAGWFVQDAKEFLQKSNRKKGHISGQMQ